MTMTKLIMAYILASVVALSAAPATADESVDTLHQLVTEKAHEHRVPTELAHAIIQVESRYNSQAFNQGSYGIGQIRCGTARGLGFTGRCHLLFDARINLDYSMAYLRQALDQTDDDYCAAATLYNQGLAARLSRRHATLY
jgi:soluble lytic murein transglycosylase-like protein